MAGSQQESFIAYPVTDPILAARMEAIKQLAGGLSDRVAVLDREFNVIYANESAWSEGASQQSGHQAKCYQAFAHRADPCGTCPATKVYDSPDVQSVACSIGGDGTACGMRQAFPLVSSSGEVESVLVLFRERPKPEKRSSVEQEDATCKSTLGELIGSSEPMREVLAMIRLVADSPATVLIQGESGTGKELVAKAIHHHSKRSTGPFVTVNSGSMPPDLLESNLFGHVKGAFTGAISNKKGLFEIAANGSIFFDEIGNIPVATQAKLLRALEQREVQPLGSARASTVT